MLTVKGIGGGSANVINGIIQEMYSAEREIPANTFVEIHKALNSSQNGITQLTKSKFNITPKYYPELSKILMGVEKDDSDTSIAIYPTIFEKGDFVQKPGVIAYQRPSSGSIWEIINAKPQFIQVSSNLIFMLWMCDTSSSTTELKFSKIVIDSEGNASVSGSSGTKLTSFTKASQQDCGDIRLKLTDSNQIVAIISCHGGGSNALKSQLYAVIINLSNDTLSYQKAITLKDINNSGRSIDVSNIKKTSEALVFVVNTGLEDENFIGILDSSFTYSEVSLDIAGTPKDGYNHLDIFTKGDQLILFDGGKTFKTYLYKLNKSALNKYSLEQVDEIAVERDDWESSGVYACEISESYYLVCKQHGTTPFGGFKPAYAVLQILEDKIVMSSPFIGIDLVLGGYNSVQAPMKLVDGKTLKFAQAIKSYITSSSSETYMYAFLLGELENLVKAAKERINGVTKTLCTESQKGKVWLLHYVHMELLASVAERRKMSHYDMAIDSSGNVYYGDDRKLYKYSNDLKKLIWEKEPYNSTEFTWGGICISKDRVFAYKSTAYIECIDASTKNVLWSKGIVRDDSEGRLYTYGMYIPNDFSDTYLYAGHKNLISVSIIPEDGIQFLNAYQYSSDKYAIIRQCFYKNGYLYTTSQACTAEGEYKDKGFVRRHKINDLQEIQEPEWEVVCDSGVYGLYVDEDGTAYIGCDDRTFQKISSTGEVKFKIFCGKYVNSITMDSQGRLYVGLGESEGKNLICFDKQGNQLCDVEMGRIYQALAADKDSNVFIIEKDAANASKLKKFKFMETNVI